MPRKISTLGCWVPIVLLLSNMAGCGGYTPVVYPNFPTNSLDQRKHYQENNGLAIGISPLTDPQEIEKYLGANLLARNVLPVFFEANNLSKKATFLFEKEGIRLGQQPGTKDGSAGLDSSKHEVLWVLAPLGVLFIPLAAHAESEYEELKMHLAVRELRNKTLSPGHQTDGFLYFSVPLDADGALAVKEVTVQIEVEDLKSKKKHQFAFPVALNTRTNE